MLKEYRQNRNCKIDDIFVSLQLYNTLKYGTKSKEVFCDRFYEIANEYKFVQSCRKENFLFMK